MLIHSNLVPFVVFIMIRNFANTYALTGLICAKRSMKLKGLHQHSQYPIIYFHKSLQLGIDVLVSKNQLLTIHAQIMHHNFLYLFQKQSEIHL